MELSQELDTLIGRDVHRRLHRIVRRVAKQHKIPEERATDFLLAGSLFVAAEYSGLSIDETVQVAAEIARSVQEDELLEATRH